MRNQIPNFLSLANLLAGSIACLLAANDELVFAAFFILIGMIIDFSDGFIARLLKATSELGKQLDSLADLVTFGLAPGLILFSLFRESISNDAPFAWLSYVSFLLPLSSAWRLAKFNLDHGQSNEFIGLPTPASALLILSFPLIAIYHEESSFGHMIYSPWFLVIITLLDSYMLHMPVKLFSLKFKNFKFSGNEYRHLFLLFSLILLTVLKFLAVPFIILLYILLSFGKNWSTSKNN